MHTRFALLVAALACTSCSAPRFALEARYGRLDAQGDLAVTSSGSPQTENSLDDLGIGGDESSLGLVADVAFGSPHLTLSTESASWSGSGTASNFGTLPGLSVPVDSDLDIAIHRGVLTFDVLPLPLVELGLGFGFSAVAVEAQVEEQLGFNEESVEGTLPVPLLAVRGAVRFWRMEVEAVVAGMSLDLGDEAARYLDADIAARLRLVSFGPLDALLSVGYRRIDLDAEFEDGDESVDLDTTLDGLYVGLRLGI